MSILKLSQETNIWILKISQIRNPVLYHDKSIEPKSKCKTTIDLRIKSSFAYHIWMYESCAHELNPTRSLTNLAPDSITKWTRKIYFYSWFYEGEISRSHTYPHFLIKYIWEHRGYGELQMSDADIFIYHNTFYLIESIVMRGIDIFIAKYSSWDDSTDRNLLWSEDEILHARCLSCEDMRFSFKPEGILHITSRMILRDIDSIEIQVLCRHLHRFIYIESHTPECVFYCSSYSSDWMKRSLILRKRKSRIFPFFR